MGRQNTSTRAMSNLCLLFIATPFPSGRSYHWAAGNGKGTEDRGAVRHEFSNQVRSLVGSLAAAGVE